MENKVIYFSLVLYNHKFEYIKPLLESIKGLSLAFKKSNKLTLLIHDNSCSDYISPIDLYKYNIYFNIFYSRNYKNIGFGAGHNSNLMGLKDISNDSLFIITNPDIDFKDYLLMPLLDLLFCTSKYSCVTPLVRNALGKIQFGVKRNPTILSLILGRFSFLNSFEIFKRYMINHNFRNFNYEKDVINSQCLPGCFLIVRPKVFNLIGGFNEIFFLHMEDADFVRRCSVYGETCHIPLGEVHHRWERGSHKSLKQNLYLLISSYLYFKCWGFKLY